MHMSFIAACREAATYRDGCTRHVNASIHPGDATGTGTIAACMPHLDEYGYTVSDWHDGTTVRSFCDGREINGRWTPIKGD